MHNIGIMSNDTLVYYIAEHDSSSSNDVDTRLYILYDRKKERFLIRGTRAYRGHPTRLSRSGKTIPEYSFCCNTIYTMTFWLDFIFDKSNRFTHEFLSVPNLPVECDEITFDLLDQYRSSRLEIAGYDKEKWSMQRIEDALEAVRSIYNDY